jgi:hypothetical protein
LFLPTNFYEEPFKLTLGGFTAPLHFHFHNEPYKKFFGGPGGGFSKKPPGEKVICLTLVFSPDHLHTYRHRPRTQGVSAPGASKITNGSAGVGPGGNNLPVHMHLHPPFLFVNKKKYRRLIFHQK